MAITNYSELKTAVANWTARSDLGTYVDEFIDLAETFLKRIPVPAESPEIGGVRGNITRATGTLTAGTATLSLPSDFQEIYRMTLTGSTFVTLRYVAPNQLAINHRTGSGLPAYFSISDVIEFDVAPDSNYAYELSYYPGVTALSDSNTTNWIITNYPDTYLSATLFHAFRFLQDQESAASWLGQYKQASWSASETYRLPRVSQGSVGIKTDSPNP
tara:strand:+ start:7678 stop:8325 length:648 start_codon:yes stop_codon:yes gene_type:complete